MPIHVYIPIPKYLSSEDYVILEMAYSCIRSTSMLVEERI
jgi:hypothetical protein